VSAKFLCRIGIHKWKLSKGRGFTVGDSPMVIIFSKDCKRCGKHVDGLMVV
jgi:hypothetical protein